MNNYEKERERQIEYGKLRETNQQKWLKKRDKEISQDINKALALARNEAKRRINEWVGKYAHDEGFSLADAARAAERADIEELSAKAKEYVRQRWAENNKVDPFSPEANKEMKKYNFSMKTSRMELLYQYLNLEIDSSGNQVEGIIKNFLLEGAQEEIRRQAGLLGLSIPTPDEIESRAKTIAAASFHGTDFSEKIWERQKDLRDELERGISQTIMLGSHPRTWSKTLNMMTDEAFDNAAYNQRRIAITESGRVQIQVQKESYQKAGYTEYVIICEPTACDICKEHDGKIRPLDKLRQGESAPMFHPFCRCSTSPKMSRVALDEILGVVNNSSGAIHGALNNKNDPYGKRREDHAKRYYQTLQKRDKNREVITVAKNSGLRTKMVKEALEHAFYGKNHLRSNGEYKPFDPSYDMSESWRRLREGVNIEEHDLILIKHENLESGLMKRYTLTYEEAHAITNRKYDYKKALENWKEGQNAEI